MSVTIDNHAFDRVHYDADRDVLYLHKGEPSTAADFDSTPEGHALRFNAAGELVGITLVSPRHWIEQEGHLPITLPHQLDVRTQPAPRSSSPDARPEAGAAAGAVKTEACRDGCCSTA